MVRNITLFAVLVYELVGPFFTKIALTRAGDIKPEGAISAREEAKRAMDKAAEPASESPVCAASDSESGSV